MSTLDGLYTAVLEGKRSQSVDLVQQALDEGVAPMVIIEQTLRPAMSTVGARFSTGEFFLPDLILSAEAMKNATAVLRPLLGTDGEASQQQTVVIGTVQGDVHDIGKNLVIATLVGQDVIMLEAIWTPFKNACRMAAWRRPWTGASRHARTGKRC
jgi:5-methyltetrahydrofolate--homocysteine methyltransferase